MLAEFIADGHFGRHLRRMRSAYAARLDVLLDLAGRDLKGLLDVSEVAAGLQTVGWLNPGMDEEAAVVAAAQRNVEVVPLGRYSQSPLPRPGLQLGFAATFVGEIRRGVREMAIALSTLDTVSRAAP